MGAVAEAPEHRLASILTLQRSRGLLASRPARSLAVAIGFVYGFVSLVVGQMVEFFPTQQTSTTVQILTRGSSPDWWNYPAVLVIAPGGVIALPFLPLVTMVIVSIGVGIGMTAGIVLAVRLLRLQKQAPSGATLASSAAGLTPAMLALVTLGACCSTTAAATAGIGAVAQASGQSITTLFLNTWYLGFFQVAVLAVALVAQEQLVILYGSLRGDARASAPGTPPSRRSVLQALFRLGLIAGGVTWLLAGLLELAAPSPGTVPALVALQVLLQHVLAGGLAMVAGLFLPRVVGWLARAPRGIRSAGLRLSVGVGGASLLFGAPAPVAGWGLGGLLNEVLGALGVPASLGGVVPPVGGLALALRWTFEMALVGGFAVTFAAVPSQLAGWLAPAAGPSPTSAPVAFASVGGP